MFQIKPGRAACTQRWQASNDRTMGLTISVLCALYKTEADLLPDPENQTLTIRVHHMANAVSDQLIEKLCLELNATETRFPRTNLRMIFKLGSN